MHIKFLQREIRKGRIIPVITAVSGMEISQIAPAVARCCQFAAQPCLPLKEQHLHIGILRGRQRRRHAGSTRSNNANNHTFTYIFCIFCYYTPPGGPIQEKLPLQSEKAMV